MRKYSELKKMHLKINMQMKKLQLNVQNRLKLFRQFQWIKSGYETTLEMNSKFLSQLLLLQLPLLLNIPNVSVSEAADSLWWFHSSCRTLKEFDSHLRRGFACIF